MILYKDKAGNTVSMDADRRLGIRNARGQLINPRAQRIVLRRPAVKLALKKYFGRDMPVRILSQKQTKMKEGTISTTWGGLTLPRRYLEFDGLE